MNEYSIDLLNRPHFYKDGDRTFLLPKNLVEKNDEIAVTISLLCNRQLFGLCYRGLMPQHYESMGRKSGVMIAPFINSKRISPSLSFPGDIDLLIIPYDQNRLNVSKSLAVEVKIVRAKYEKQGKAPNEFGFSQANGLLLHGFPYAAVAHVIISDSSPQEAWRPMLQGKIVDGETGTVDELQEAHIDMLPVDLIKRSFGRLKANQKDDSLGLLAAYHQPENNILFFPHTSPSKRNRHTSQSALKEIGKFYENNYQEFLDTPKY